MEERSHKFIYHWFIFMVAGLKNIDTSNYPIYIKCPLTQGFQKETLELLEPEFKYIENIPEDAEIINNYGSPILTPSSIPDEYYQWLRNFILKKIPLPLTTVKKGRYYISRNKAPLLECNSGDKKRLIVNENDVFNSIEDLGFEKIFLEDFSLINKIKVFQEAEMIVTPNGGALTFGLFGSSLLKVIEIHHPDSTEDMYKNISLAAGLKFKRYTNVSSVDRSNNPVPYKFIGDYLLRVNDLKDFKANVKNFLEE